MLTQLLKVGALIATGRFLKPRLKGLLWVAAVWLVLWFVHSEYVEYVQLSGDTSLVLKASLLKTGLYALSIAVYVLLVERRLWPKPVKMPPAHNSSVAAAVAAEPVRKALPTGADDGFDFLRSKRKLRNKADELLKK
jgi:hypothetical protein